MFMPVIGSLYSSMRNMQLNMQWQKRKNNVRLPKGVEEDPQIEQFKRQMVDTRKGNAIAALDGKLKAGGLLTDDELEYLRTNSPELYQKAIEIRREREQYKKELENCKTKDDVEKLNAGKMQRFLSAVHNINGNPNITSGKKRELLEQITRRLMGVLSEHSAFTKSKEYADLPREAELREEEKRRKAKKVSAQEQDTNYTKELLDLLKSSFEQLDEKPVEEAEKSTPPKSTDAPPKAGAPGNAPEPTKIYDAKGAVRAEGTASAVAIRVKVKISAKA